MGEPGQRIAGRYRVEAELGRGGMGVVLRAHDEKLGRSVAIKVLPRERLGDASARARLLREARAAAALDHPGVVRVLDVGEDDEGGAYLVMELIRGRSIRERLADPAFDRAARLGALVSLARTLGAVHRAGFVHRDVKPENVMLTDDGRVLLLDLGLAKLHSPERQASGDAATVTSEGTILGTPAYLAPEQAHSPDVDARADQFALGVVVYELVVGRLPWTATTALGVLGEVLTATPPAPSTVDASIPTELDAIVAKAMAKSPDDRYGTADELAAALERLAKGPVTRRPPAPSPAPSPAPAPTRGAAPASRPRAAWIVLGVIALLAIGGTIIALRGPAPLATDAVVACPPLVAHGIDAPLGWLGAAAASSACRQIAALRGRADLVRLPAQLLDVDPVPTDAHPEDVFDQPTSRETAIAAARRADAWFDGEVSATESGFRVVLVLRDGGAVELARGEATGVTVTAAVRNALDLVLAGGVLTTPTRLSEEQSAWWGTHDPRVAAWLAALDADVMTGDITTECEALEGADLAADTRARVAFRCATLATDRDAPAATVALDTTSGLSLARSALALSVVTPDAVTDAVAAQLAERRASEPSAFAQARLIGVEAALRGAHGEPSRELALAGVQRDPTWEHGWEILGANTSRELGIRATHDAYVAWVPECAHAWNGAGLPTASDAARPEYVRRAVVMGARMPIFVENLARMRIAAGDLEGARSLAARLAIGVPWLRVGADAIDVDVDVADTRFGVALERALAGLERVRLMGRMGGSTEGLLVGGFAAAEVLGREDDLVEPFVRRFLDPSPPLVDRTSYNAQRVIAPICALTPDRALGRRCLARLRWMVDAGWAANDTSAGVMLEAAEALVDGDAATALRLSRRMRPSRFVAMAAIAAGDPDADARVAEWAASSHSVTLAHVVSARRAAERGDRVAASAFAREVVDAWAGADVAVPVLDEMRTLIAAAPAP